MSPWRLFVSVFEKNFNGWTGGNGFLEREIKSRLIILIGPHKEKGVMGMRKALLGLFLAMFIIFGCATPYQRSGFRGGYSDFRIDSNTFKVQFKGNAYTPRETVEIYALYRCAEVTLEAGYDYFILLSERGEISRQTTATPGFYRSTYSRGKLSGFYIPSQFIQTDRHGSFVTIKAFHGRKLEGYVAAYDASEIIQYAGPKVKKLPPTSSTPKPSEVRREFAGPKLDEYHAALWPKIKEKWQPTQSIGLEATIVVVIGRDGEVKQVWFEKNSGNRLYDEEAMAAIRKAEPFPPLPIDLNSDTLRVGIRFYKD